MSLPLFAPWILLAAAPPFEATLVISEHRLVPSHLEVPAGRKIELKVTNQQSVVAEIESYALNREKVIRPGKTVTLYVGPLEPGSYDLFDDDQADTASGTLEVR